MPDVSRRNVLKLFCTGAALASTPIAVNASAELDTNVWWSGWREPSNMMISFGFWAVQVPADEMGRNILLSTTCGDVGRYRELEQIYLANHKEWPTIGPWSKPSDREDVKARALAALKEALKRA